MGSMAQRSPRGLVYPERPVVAACIRENGAGVIRGTAVVHADMRERRLAACKAASSLTCCRGPLSDRQHVRTTLSGQPVPSLAICAMSCALWVCIRDIV